MKKILLKYLKEYVLDLLLEEVVEPLRAKSAESDNNINDEAVDYVEAKIRKALK